ncbi:glycosyltransferase [bacterium]|nr:glycosyltransferase [bacterium]
MNIVFIETFYGGSHQAFLDGLMKYSRHHIMPVTFPARFWKWRMRTSATYIAETCGEALRNCDLIVATDYINLAELKALTRYTCPAILFLHENQLSYPTPEGEKPAVEFGLVNFVSALTADLCLFNSHYHFREFEAALRQLINGIPEFVPEHARAQILSKSQVVYMGLNISAFPHTNIPMNPVPIILWNHRWEFDKQPAVFFEALYRLAQAGQDFRVIILGENFQVHPQEFILARERLGERILRFGFVESLEDYVHFLSRSDIVVSTAIQENFGFSVTEAMYCHVLPLLPNRLSYPEILPKKFHRQFLYESTAEMDAKLRYLLQEYRNLDHVRRELAEAMNQFTWKNRIDEFDHIFEQLVARQRSH